MATQQLLRQEDVWSEKFAATRDFLARFGIAPREADLYPEDDVFKAIRARGWEPNIVQEHDPPGWRAEIQEWRSVTQSQVAIGRDRNRMMALLKALRVALQWPTAKEELEAFNKLTQSIIGLSAAEFFERWRNNELPDDDPRVAHLLIAAPIGW